MDSSSCIAVIAGMLIGEQTKTGAPWLNIVKAELGSIIFVILFAIIVEAIVKILKGK